MIELVVAQVRSANALRSALSPGDAAKRGEYDHENGTLTVDDRETAEMLVDTYPNVRWSNETVRTDHESDTTDDASPRGELDTEDVTYRCGVNDCSREVNSPDATCWQHTPDEE